MKNKLILFLLTICTSFVSCGSDDSKTDGKANPEQGTLNKNVLVLYVDKTEQLTYSGSDKCTWSSDNSLIASVDNGIVKANHVGTTTIHANNATCTVTVYSLHNSFTEPYLKWGANMSTVKSNMSSYTLSKSDNEYLIYTGKGNVLMYGYRFKNGSLDSSSMYINLANSIILTDYLTDRYITIDVDTDEYQVYMVSTDNSMMVGLKVTTSGTIVVYLPAPSTKAISTSINENFNCETYENLQIDNTNKNIDRNEIINQFVTSLKVGSINS